MHVAVAGVPDDADGDLHVGGDLLAAVDQPAISVRGTETSSVSQVPQHLQRGQHHPPGRQQQSALGQVVGDVAEDRPGLRAQPRSSTAISSAAAAPPGVGLADQERRACLGVQDPVLRCASTARMQVASMISSSDGHQPGR